MTKPLDQLLKNSVLDLPRLTLRPLTMDDLKDYHEYSSDPETLKYDYPAHKSLEESRKMLIKWHLANPAGKYGIYLKAEQKIIGNINLNCYDDDVFVGFTINKKYWRKAYGTEALLALLSLAFNEAGLSKITAKVDARNIASKKLLEKVGFKLVKSEKEVTDYRNIPFDEDTYVIEKHFIS